jgi:hypothetical protein
MGDRDEELGIADTSGLRDADWVEINKLRDAYRTGGQKALRDAWRKLTDDPIRTVRVYGAFFPAKLRNTIKDVMAAEGMTVEDLTEMIEKAKSAAPVKKKRPPLEILPAAPPNPAKAVACGRLAHRPRGRELCCPATRSSPV